MIQEQNLNGNEIKALYERVLEEMDIYDAQKAEAHRNKKPMGAWEEWQKVMQMDALKEFRPYYEEFRAGRLDPDTLGPQKEELRYVALMYTTLHYAEKWRDRKEEYFAINERFGRDVKKMIENYG